jgi:hypothetical protein
MMILFEIKMLDFLAILLINQIFLNPLYHLLCSVLVCNVWAVLLTE